MQECGNPPEELMQQMSPGTITHRITVWFKRDRLQTFLKCRINVIVLSLCDTTNFCNWICRRRGNSQAVWRQWQHAWKRRRMSNAVRHEWASSMYIRQLNNISFIFHVRYVQFPFLETKIIRGCRKKIVFLATEILWAFHIYIFKG